MTSESYSPTVTIDVREILRFFDEKPDWSIKQATSIVGVVGEDLNAACFQHYLRSIGASANLMPHPVTTGKRKGPQLDRWIVVDWPEGHKTVFQTEIKNWSAHAIGGETLPIEATPERVADYKRRRWEMRWDSQQQTLKTALTAKVLVPMKLLGDLEEHAEDVRPLLIFWEALGPSDQVNNHLFRVPSPGSDFSELWVFSVSSYLRSISHTNIELEMMNASHRLQIIGRLFPKTLGK